MFGLLEDPGVWLGVLAGALAVLLPLGCLWYKGKIIWQPPGSRHSASLLRSLSLLSAGDETWYDALEEAFPGTAGVVDYASRVVPLLLGEEGRLEGCSPSTKPRLLRLNGTSVPKLAPEDRGELSPSTGFHRASWSVGCAADFKVRRGPNYLHNQAKEPSAPALYECVGVDIVSAGCRIDEAIPRLGPLPAGGAGWTPSSRVPRCLIVNCQMPFEEGPKFYGEHPADDTGVSVICQFVATPELLTLDANEAVQAPELEARRPAVRLLQTLFERGTLDLPDNERPGNSSSCALKAIGWVENLETVKLPRLLKSPVERYNGKPILLANCGRMSRDVSGEWMEIDFDVRDFSWPTRSALSRLRDRFRSVSSHVGFVIQGTEDDELPEVVLANLRLHSMDLDHGAWIDDPRASS